MADLSVLPSPLYSFGGKSAAMVTSVEPIIRITATVDRVIFVRSDIAASIFLYDFLNYCNAAT